MYIKFLAGLAATVLVFVLATSGALAQGKGKGKGGGGGQGQGSGKSSGGGQGQGQGQGSGKSSGSGQGQGSGKSTGNSDSVASDPMTKTDDSTGKSHGKGKGDEQRALHAKEKAGKMSDNELNRYKGLSKKLGTTPEEMRARYEAALVRDPNLTYGNFVSAHMAADNLGDKYPNVTSDAILIGMSKGRSLGQTLQDLKVAPAQVTTTQDSIKTRLRPILGN